MKVLVLVTKYPNDDSQSMMYVHVRNKYYANNNINVTVLNFDADSKYQYDGINVISLNNYNGEKYDLLLCHAANLRQHYRFIKKYNRNFKKIVFFYPGHEILRFKDVYPPEYEWKKHKKNIFFQNIYDSLKFKLWRNELNKIKDKSYYVFVSNWLYYRFLYYIHINPKFLENKCSIINNSVGKIFEEKSFDKLKKKNYDFITIRGGGLDGSKYGVDIVCELAINNPEYRFLIIGKGEFFNNVNKPKNVEFINKSLTHQEMIEYLNQSKCALFPTREDTQGVLACEMFTFGIPTITSNIEVCREIFKNIDNVELIDNDYAKKINLEEILTKLDKKPAEKNERYFEKNTIKKEVELFKKILKDG